MAINLNNAKARHANESQYAIGNDKIIPESAWAPDSYQDGIHTQFNTSAGVNGWDDVQDTFKLNQSANAWFPGMLEGVSEADVSGFNGSALFFKSYNTNESKVTTEAFPEIAESGRSDYVSDVPQAAE